MPEEGPKREPAPASAADLAEPAAIGRIAEGGADLRGAEEPRVVVGVGVGRGGVESDGSTVGNVRGAGTGEHERRRRLRGWVGSPATMVVGGELVLGGNEGEEAFPEAGGANADALLVRVALALHRVAFAISLPVLRHRPLPPPPPPPLPDLAIDDAPNRAEQNLQPNAYG